MKIRRRKKEKEKVILREEDRCNKPALFSCSPTCLEQKILDHMRLLELQLISHIQPPCHLILEIGWYQEQVLHFPAQFSNCSQSRPFSVKKMILNGENPLIGKRGYKLKAYTNRAPSITHRKYKQRIERKRQKKTATETHTLVSHSYNNQ